MPLVSFSKVCVSFGTQDVLKNLSFIVRERSKVGLIGPNGSGKSTIVRLLSGELTPDSGEIMRTRDMRVGFVRQELARDCDSVPLLEYIKSDFSDIFDLEKRISALEAEISRLDAGHHFSSKGNAVMEEYSRVTEEYSRNDGYALLSKIRSMLSGLGFTIEEHEKPLGKFSGGMKTRAQLCKLLLREYDLIVLDEPTNYLDTRSLEFLENFLRNAPVAALIISHDRYFLDEVCDHILYLYNKQVEEFPGNYTSFTELFELRQNQRMDEYEKQQEFIKKTEEFYERYKAGIKSKMARGRKKFIDRMERLEDPEVYKKTVNLDFSSNMTVESGRVVVSADGLSKSFGAKTLFANGAFEVARGSITGVIGANGTGKTTLLKMIKGEIADYEGRITLGHNVTIGYQDQLLTGLDPEKRVIDVIWDMKRLMTEGEVRNYLAKFLFSGDDAFKMVKNLSGGEKSRLILAGIIMGGANTLILDEPTNHLDIPSKEMLESALANFDGTVLFVSHDRYFIDKVADGLIAIEDGRIRYYNGNYSYYREKSAEMAAAEAAASAAAQDRRRQAQPDPAREQDASKKQLSKNAERMIREEIARTEEAIAKAEERSAAIERAFSDNAVDGKPLSFAETEKLNKEYRELGEETTGLYEKLEALEASLK